MSESDAPPRAEGATDRGVADCGVAAWGVPDCGVTDWGVGFAGAATASGALITPRGSRAIEAAVAAARRRFRDVFAAVWLIRVVGALKVTRLLSV